MTELLNKIPDIYQVEDGKITRPLVADNWIEIDEQEARFYRGQRVMARYDVTEEFLEDLEGIVLEFVADEATKRKKRKQVRQWREKNSEHTKAYEREYYQRQKKKQA